MFSSKKLLKKVCMLLVTSMALSCFPAVKAEVPDSNTTGKLETTSSIIVSPGDAVNLTVKMNSTPKYDNGLPIQLVDSVLPSQYDVAVYLRVKKVISGGTPSEEPVTPWIKVWDNFLLTDRLKYVSVTDVSSTYKIYSYIDGKGNYDDVSS